MGTNRLEAFSDGVIAIIITIMVLELKLPPDTGVGSLMKLAPVFSSYVLSFLVVAIMWVNHHHMLHAVKRVDARVLWANNLLLFWMSLIPFVTVYMGQNHMAPLPVALYGVVMTLSAAAFSLLRYVFMQQHRGDPEWCMYHSRILRKNLVSMAFYAVSVPLAFVSGYLSFAIFVLIALAYFLPEPKLAGRDQ